MNIGEKIRELRVAKLMTQAELAGTHITRNMLSCIENGSANPSLSTILYIAGRLNVPGRPIQYRTTPNFLRTFGLSTLDELPTIDKVSLGEPIIPEEQPDPDQITMEGV